MEYITYKNRRNPHITIHRVGCDEIRKRGGVGEGEYHDHQTLDEAEAYAQGTDLPVIRCSRCNP